MKRWENEPDIEDIKREVFPKWWQVEDEKVSFRQKFLLGRLLWKERKRTHRKNLATRRMP